MNTAASLPRVEAIVIGASAGGVEALLSILGPLREGFVLPIIVVLHLPDERRSQLAEVFSRRVSLPVIEARDKTVVEAGTLYFAAPGYHLSVEQDRSFSLSLEDRVHHSRPAIDYLFESAADAYGPLLAAILLTGANRDGACGMAQIKHRGGLTVVQDPDEAQVATMPQAALALHQPDYILPIHGIGRLLVELERIAC
ncbi:MULTISPECIES: chemotaxis protein CheB [unclassified Pseudomonas]|uniref:chemotaxis protein CheB n=1 Tax=unclassified Pseudomonas TaxID=196821 RepID=UPI002AC99589|nr:MULTISPECIES: chemotaxis protein CheB [unclassified Pseudomonas]MEB0045155.1 chemotaxis protein CheB [Pseudomonas sp. Dout3]MEB0096489.1 chemotaxis protein CheB [Pseudomonas sp. DC1.2]WPX61441.1 chemotaxis protein CheB [Pseudomonas sp. DC1.2]